MLQKLAGQIEQSMFRYGHMEIVEEKQLVKRIVQSDVRGKRLRERPQTGWMDSVKIVLD